MSGSPDRYFFFFFPGLCLCVCVSHTVRVTTILAFIIIIEEEWRTKIFKRVQSPIGYVLNCFWKGGSVIFGFHLISRCLSATLYFVRNQSLMWQETVLFEHKVIWKVLSLNKKNRHKCKIVWQKLWKYKPNFRLHDVPWLLYFSIGILSFLVVPSSL